MRITLKMNLMILVGSGWLLTGFTNPMTDGRILGIWQSADNDVRVEMYARNGQYHGRLVWRINCYQSLSPVSMKNFLFAAPGDLLLLTSCARQNESVTPASATAPAASAVPAPTVATLQQNFPTATQVSWTKLAQQTYKVLFQVNSRAKTARISANGTLLSAHDVIDPATLPAAVTTYLDTNHKGYTFGSASVEKDKAGTVMNYEVKFTLNGETYEAEFDATGTFLKLDD